MVIVKVRVQLGPIRRRSQKLVLKVPKIFEPGLNRLLNQVKMRHGKDRKRKRREEKIGRDVREMKPLKLNRYSIPSCISQVCS